MCETNILECLHCVTAFWPDLLLTHVSHLAGIMSVFIALFKHTSDYTQCHHSASFLYNAVGFPILLDLPLFSDNSRSL